MKRSRIRLGLSLISIILPISVAVGQASAYVPLGDPSLPLFEHLVARGTVKDPSPFVRPFLRAEAVKALRSAHGDTAEVHLLLKRWATPDSLWEATARLGSESFSSARLDPLHPLGTGGTRLRGDVRLTASVGRLVLVTNPTMDERASLDPDWPGLRAAPNEVCCRWRFPEAYLSWQPGSFHLYYGTIGRNWGPVGLPGIAISNVAYPRDEIGIEMKTQDLHLLSVTSQLKDTHTDDGKVIHRYHTASRLALQIGDRLNVAGWQTAILQGNDRELEGPFRNPLMLLPLANEYGMGDTKINVMIGLQVQYRVGTATTLQLEGALDDYMLHNRENFPDRYAFTLSATGPVLHNSAYRASYTRASSLAFRTTNPNENFTEDGVGLGRNFADNDQLTLTLTRPVSADLLGGASLTVLRQGEGRLDAPYNAIMPLRGMFLGVVERTVRAGGQLNGRVGPFTVQGDLGVSLLNNADHVLGKTATRMNGRLSALIQVGTKGTLRWPALLPPLATSRLNAILARFSEVRVLVVGDLMLDRYLMGGVTRISPEAPVPIVDLLEERDVPGGAANVAANVRALGGRCRLVGAVGADTPGDALLQALTAFELPTNEIVRITDRPTTTKTRILAQGQQLVRIDREVTNALPARHRETLITFSLEAMKNSNALILEDYDKGVLDPEMIATLIAAARHAKIPIVVDPKAKHFFDYAGATVFKPNRRELDYAFGSQGGGTDLSAARERLKVDHLLVTLGGEGMDLVSKDKPTRRAPGIPREVFDVSGAGDTVSAWLGASLAAGATIEEATWLANVAASVKVGKRGTAVVTQSEVLAHVG